MKEDSEKEAVINRFKSVLDGMNQVPAGDFNSLCGNLQSVCDAFHQALAERFEPALNTFLAQSPHATLAEKRGLSAQTNAVLSSLGLAILCEKTRKQAFLGGDAGNDPRRGRFQLRITEDPNFQRTKTSVDLFHLHLVPRHTQQSSEHSVSSWPERIRPPREGPPATPQQNLHKR